MFGIKEKTASEYCNKNEEINGTGKQSQTRK
jgi:hypothetical protein